ncbi:MAG: SIMPL domain-containing protein [Rubrivivax sp.]|nr:SIMPL domain-containing protein [Rubrivivax sp.]
MKRSTRAAAAAALTLAGHSAMAQVQPAPQNVVNLSASASVEVANDWLTIVFSTSRDGSDAAAVQAQLKAALEAALAEARKAARPGQVEVQTGNFSLNPRYTPKGGISGWQGQVELIVEGRDTVAVAALAGKVQTLTVQRVGFSLSREARQKVESEVASQAIDRFRVRAEAVSRQFGFGGYTIREVNVVADASAMVVLPRARLQMSQAMVADSGALPTEGGKATVTANVSGSVQMTK